ncbi:hypothetical protein AX15_001842 [Amanita polypyramis BW_CC]|nr:hypothetical protein AX15_001842 [Amanita polypyramis BW_CC]
MSTQFGWSDTLYALSNCFTCATVSADSLHNYAQSSPQSSTPSRNRTRTGSWSRPFRSQSSSQSVSDSLRPFLQQESTDDEQHLDALSLHSNLGGTNRSTGGRGHPSRVRSDTDGVGQARSGRPSSKTKSKGRRKRQRQDDGWLKIFGYDLFGKRKPGVQLPLTDDEEDGEPEGSSTSGGRISRTQSGGTLDSDAAPLDDEAIAAFSRAHMSSPDNDTNKQLPDKTDEELALLRGRVRQAEKEERRRRRREQKEREALERVSVSRLSLDDHGIGGKFEGFQGSGDGVLVEGLEAPPHSNTSITLAGDGDPDEEALADLGGSMYTRPVPSSSGAGGALNSGSRTTTTSTTTRSSRTSDSQSYYRSRSPHTHQVAADQFHEGVIDSQGDQKKKPKSRKSAPLASNSTGTNSTRSPSLPSPTGSTSLGADLSFSLSPSFQAQPETLQPSMGAKGMVPQPFGQSQTIFPEEPPFVVVENALSTQMPPPQILGRAVGDNRGFPSVGFGRSRWGRGGGQLNGAFLARRGDD